jgi:hypothetical protein
MRNTTIVGLSAAIVFVLAVSYGPDVRTAEMPQKALPGATLAIDVMQMMRDAKNLPEQQYEAI